MKYLPLILTALLALSAHANEPPKEPPNGTNPALEQALAECRAIIDGKKDRLAFDGCMKGKGFDRPKDKPKSQ